MTKRQRAFISIYLLLIAICVCLLIGGSFLPFQARDFLLPIAADGFKLVLGALVGALSAMLGVTGNDKGA